MGQRPDAHKIGERAVRILKSQLPDSWICRDQRPDYGVDLELEFGNSSDDLSGEVLKVQVKGHRHLRCRDGVYSERIKVSTARYWMRLRMPIILASVDNATEAVYWIDAAKALRRLSWASLTERRQITLPISDAETWGTPASFGRLHSKIAYDYDWRTTIREFDSTLDRLPELLRLAAWLDRCDSWMPMEENDARRWRELRALTFRLAGASEVQLPPVPSIAGMKDTANQRGYNSFDELPYGMTAEVTWTLLPSLFGALDVHRRVVIVAERSFWMVASYDRFERWFAAEFPGAASMDELRQFAFEHE